MSKMEFSKKMLLLHIAISVALCTYVVWGAHRGLEYAQRFLKQFADKYGADIAIRAAEIVLKD